jgi:glycosyltransferase involved in cell wall biosynthesis
MNCLTLIFSKDRALQLDATLRSLLLHCRDAESMHIRVLYTTTPSPHTEQYIQLEKEYHKYSFIQFIREQDFRSDVLALLAPFEHVLFLVDDNIFVHDFHIQNVIEMLNIHRDALACSLRLGKNTTYCYPMNASQRLPDFEQLQNGMLKFNWTKGEHDFGYPMEVSSSVYRVDDIVPFIARFPYRNPNTLEAFMNENKPVFQEDKPLLLCYEQSVTFCAPVNIVQTMWPNRMSKNIDYSPSHLAELFAKGYRVAVDNYSNFIPNACHQEVELKLIEPRHDNRDINSIIPAYPKSPRRTSPDSTFIKEDSESKQPLVSVIIPCYNYGHFLKKAVESVLMQTYTNFEIIIVNDGSADDTRQIAEDLITSNPNHRMHLINQPNSGKPAVARNKGIERSKGEYILCLDADDMINTAFLKECVAVLDANPYISIARPAMQMFGDDNKFSFPPEYNFELLKQMNIMVTACMFRKKAWKEVGGYDTNISGYEDWDFWISCGEHKHYAQPVPNAVFFYRFSFEGTRAKHVTDDQQIKAQIVLKHHLIYNPSQVIWAKGIIEKDPDILAIPHREGIIPFFETPSISGFSESEVEQHLRSDREQELENMYVNTLQSLMGMSLPEAEEYFRDMLKEARDESVREGNDRLPQNYGDYLLKMEPVDANIKSMLSARRKEGVRDEDIRCWWNKDVLERKLTAKFDNKLRQSQLTELMRNSGLKEGDALAIIKKNYPVFDLDDNASLTDDEDSNLPFELMERVNNYIENSFRNQPGKLNKSIESSSSLNALIRREIKQGNI